MVYLAKRSKTESAKSKVETASGLAGLGGAIGSVFSPVGAAIGAGIGGVTGLIIGDKETVFPIDMVAIPAYQAYLINGTPALTVYIKAGETLVPTGGNVQDMKENMSLTAVSDAEDAKKLRMVNRKPSAYNKRYSKAFEGIKDAYKRKDGSWKKDGFKRAVRKAHYIAKGGRK